MKVRVHSFYLDRHEGNTYKEILRTSRIQVIHVHLYHCNNRLIIKVRIMCTYCECVAASGGTSSKALGPLRP